MQDLFSHPKKKMYIFISRLNVQIWNDYLLICVIFFKTQRPSHSVARHESERDKKDTALCLVYSSNEVLHHLDFFLFLSDILTNNFKPSFLKLHSLKEFDNIGLLH